MKSIIEDRATFFLAWPLLSFFVVLVCFQAVLLTLPSKTWGHSSNLPADFKISLASAPTDIRTTGHIKVESALIKTDGPFLLPTGKIGGETVSSKKIRREPKILHPIYEAINHWKFFELTPLYEAPAFQSGDWVSLKLTASAATYIIAGGLTTIDESYNYYVLQNLRFLKRRSESIRNSGSPGQSTPALDEINKKIAETEKALEDFSPKKRVLHLGSDSSVWCTYTAGDIFGIPISSGGGNDTLRPQPAAPGTTPGDIVWPDYSPIDVSGPVNTPVPTGDGSGGNDTLREANLAGKCHLLEGILADSRTELSDAEHSNLRFTNPNLYKYRMQAIKKKISAAQEALEACTPKNVTVTSAPRATPKPVGSREADLAAKRGVLNQITPDPNVNADLSDAEGSSRVLYDQIYSGELMRIYTQRRPVITSVPSGDGDGTKSPTAKFDPYKTLYIKTKASVLDSGGQLGQQSTAGQQIKLFAPSTIDVALPGDGVKDPNTDAGEDPIQGTTDKDGNLALGVPGGFGPRLTGSYEVNIDSTSRGGQVVELGGDDPGLIDTLSADLRYYVTDRLAIGGSTFFTLSYPLHREGKINNLISDTPGVITSEPNLCRDKLARPNDPYFKGKGSWKQKYDDQWAIKHVGFTGGNDSAWKAAGKKLVPVVVAVIDTGLDWNHLDFDWKNIWKNKGEIPDNGKDDDKNGYVDDVIGWDFYGRTNRPWDHDGHGTIVAGIIAATQNNGVGIAGINPRAKIMVLKAVNNFGHSRASYLAKAIVYAADNGARIISMSVGGKNLSTIEQKAVDYAIKKDVLIIMAAGNEGVDTSNYGIAAHQEVVVVASTDFTDKRARFSNWGAQVNIAAPGLDVLSLRARRTDTMRDIPEVKYEKGANYVGKDKRYYRASGTSFSAPIVAGTASLILSKYPKLKSEDVKRMLFYSAKDIETPGKDQYTGYGLLDARAALKADPKFFIDGSISGVQVIRTSKGVAVQVNGSATSDRFKKAWIEIGPGESPTKWKKVSDAIRDQITNGVLGNINANEFRGAKVWFIKLTVEHENGQKRETRFRLSLG